MPLNKFQEQFKDLVLDHPDALQNLDGAFADLFQKNGIALSDRLSVYRNNIVGSLTDVMIESFPCIKALVGEDFLTLMARSFVLDSPPDAGCLNFYGRGFAEFIETFPPAKDLPYLADMARLEIAWNDSYYAKDQAAFTIQDLANIKPDDLSNFPLKLCDHIKLLDSNYPIKALWDYCKHDHNTDQAIAAPDISDGGGHLMLYRENFRVHIKEITQAEYIFLDSFNQNASLGEALEKASKKDQHFDIAIFLETFLSLETFLAS